jgi:hypothetical protein
MGSILLFPTREEIGRRRRHASPVGPGRILLFTGVRYEHWQEPEPDTSEPTQTRSASRRRVSRSHRQA